MKKDIYAEKPNEIFAIIGENGLNRVQLNAKEISHSVITDVCATKRDKIIDYRQLDDKHMIALYHKSIGVFEYKTKKKLHIIKF